MNLVSEAARLAAEWSFAPTEELPGGHCSHVYADASRVLKVPYQGEEMTSGYLAMVRLSGPFAPKIFAHDEATGSMLMERATPGTQLHETVCDDDEFEVFEEVVHAFRRMDTTGLMSMRQYYLDSKDALVDFLLDTTPEEVALHGDLHHSNILRHGDGWMVIDAKGLVGDPAVEGAAFVCNPMENLATRSVDAYEMRIESVAMALGVSPFRVWAWSLCRMREDICEPGQPWYHALVALDACAETFGGERFVEPLT